MTTQLSPTTATPTGNTYDKYGSTNPLERKMMAGFMKALDGMLDGLAPTRILEVGVGEGEVMGRVRERFPGVPIVGLDLPDDELAGLAPRRILEIGVGEGHVMSRVRERFPGVPLVGVDLPDDALSDEWKEQGLPCMFGDATTLPFPDDSFDLVLAIEVLEHVPGPDAALGELARVLSLIHI